MSEQENVKLVQDIYAAFGRGDIPAVLAALADDVELAFAGPPELPFAGVHRGQHGMARFFTIVAENVEIEAFEAFAFIAQGGKVVAQGRERARARPTGKPWETEWAMVWTVRDGKVTHVQEYQETATIAAAFRP